MTYQQSAAAFLCLLCACTGGGEPTAPEDEDPNEMFSGGAATVFDTTRSAFAQPIPDLEREAEDEFFVGNAIFNRSWVTAPASVVQFDGLGPLFNATNCSACHLKDGRGRPPEDADEPLLSMLVRLSVPGEDAHGGPLGEPTYGGQLQGRSVLGVPEEGVVRIEYAEQSGQFADGEQYSLRAPTYSIDTLAFGPMADDVLLSPRVAPAVFGLGLLSAIDDETLEALADPDDEDGDGISGRVNHVWDAKRGRQVVGRFGWKSNQPTLEQQTAGAFAGDIGISSEMFPADDCTTGQAACLEQPSGSDGDAPELSAALLASVVRYMHTLAVPARRDVDDPTVRRGKALFGESGCEGCHVPKLRTGSFPEQPELEDQTIRPYTDLLLHDMGDELADGRPDFEADGNEWRTPPLWGIGLVQRVNRHSFFLHDGRARGLLEAILWHGGEAEAARDAVLALAAEDREALVVFLESL